MLSKLASSKQTHKQKNHEILNASDSCTFLLIASEPVGRDVWYLDCFGTLATVNAVAVVLAFSIGAETREPGKRGFRKLSP